VVVALSARPAWAEAGQSPVRGTFLIASRDLVDPNFRETVVIMLDYGQTGAVGLVINRPTEVPVSRLVPYIAALRDREDRVFNGGPVEPLRMTFLFRSRRQPEKGLAILDEVWAASSFELLEDTAQQSEVPIRVFAGYAGWAPGQLDGEIERRSWHVMDGEADAVFSPEPGKLWRELIQRTELRVVRP